MSAESIQLHYQRCPLEHVKRIVFELTRACNLRCKHCRNDDDRGGAAVSLQSLKAVVDAARPLGIDRFDFIGREVTRFAESFIPLLEHISAGSPAALAVVSNGSRSRWLYHCG